ncbi:ABC transporter permease [Salininema proteolyticum]|uniref:ABC transporter permease n=1 Tax=Salininema proteolyticum TaxID=1607685 RepID=A0ABV8U1B3_9ACTN
MTATAPEKEPGIAKRMYLGLTRSKAGFVGALLLAFVLGVAYIGPFFVGWDNPQVLRNPWAPPSSEHWLGTNNFGQDVFQQTILGGLQPITIGIFAGAIALVVAIVLGSLAGYLRGWFDTLILYITDMIVTIPALIVVLLLISFLGNLNPWQVGLVIGLTAWPYLTRAIRAQVMSLKEREFVEAAKLQEVGTARILFVDIVPNMVGFLAISFVQAINLAIYSLVGMYVLGLLPPNENNWGVMVNEGWQRNAFLHTTGLLYILIPLLLIVLFTVALVTVQRSLEQVFNPRLRER